MKRLISFLSAVCFCAVLAAKPVNADGPVPSGPKPKDRPSVCLVLAGGGSRGFAHLPIIQKIEELGIPIDMVVGTSIGAIVGGVYSAGYSIPEITNELYNINWSDLILDSAISPYEEILDEHSSDRNIVDIDFSLKLKPYFGKGFSNGQEIYTMLKEMTLKYPSNLDFNDLQIPFRAVVTDMLSGEAVVLSDGDIAEAIRASMSIPAVFEPVVIEGHYYIDGGIRYNLAINVAKNMGYDIIIGVDISQKVRDNPDSYNTHPLINMLNTITIGQYVSTSQLQKEADLVIYPEVGAYGTLDFKKGKEIYQKGVEAAELYEPELEQIRKKIFPSDYDSDGNRISPKSEPKTRGTYKRKANLVPTELQIEGAYPRDVKYIKKAFGKLQDEELTKDRFEDFIQSIYRTGNYISVEPQIYDDGENAVLKLVLTQEDYKGITVALDAEMRQTIGENRVTRFDFNPDIEICGLSGNGSLIALRAQSINDFALSLYYMQPFNPNFFVQMDCTWLEENYMANETFTMNAFKYNYDSGTTFNSWKSNLNFGFRTDNGNLIKANFFMDYGHTFSFSDNYVYSVLYNEYGTSSPVINEFLFESPYYAAGGKLNYTLDTMDHSAFAHQGFYLNSIAECLVPFNMSGRPVMPEAIVSLELRGAIPIGKQLTVGLNLFAGNEFTDTLKSNFLAVPFENFTSYDRVYFPQIGEKKKFGTKKYAGMINLQLDPFGDLTIIGGGLLFRLTGTVGMVAYTYKQMVLMDLDYRSNFPLLWSGSFDIGIRIKDGYNILLRFGAGSTYDQSRPVNPFFALDIGSIRF